MPAQVSKALPVVKETPFSPVSAKSTPSRDMYVYLAELKRLGFVGVHNFPTVGIIDGQFRQRLEETNMGYSREVETIQIAHWYGLLTTPYVFSANDAIQMAKAGADIIVAHAGLKDLVQTKRSLVGRWKTVLNLRDAACSVNPKILVLSHGGPIVRPADAQYVLSRTKRVHGFFGESSMERLPMETAIQENAAELSG